MKWFNALAIKFKNIFSRSDPGEQLLNLKKAKKLYLSNQLSQALLYFDKAIGCGSDVSVFKLRARCLQKLNRHSKAIEDFDQLIEDNPLEFSNYYRRAISKKAIADLRGQIEDITACIYYYKKYKNPENSILKNIETDLIDAENYTERVKNSIISIHNVPYLEIKNLINESLRQIKKIRLEDNRFKKFKKNEMLLQN